MYQVDALPPFVPFVLFGIEDKAISIFSEFESKNLVISSTLVREHIIHTLLTVIMGSNFWTVKGTGKTKKELKALAEVESPPFSPDIMNGMIPALTFRPITV